MTPFRIQCMARILLIAATLLAAVYLLVGTRSYVGAALVGLAAAMQVRGLIRYVEKSNRDLARLLRSIRYSDFSQTFTAEGRGGSFAELSGAFREVMGQFRAARAEKEEQHRYLHTVDRKSTRLNSSHV